MIQVSETKALRIGREYIKKHNLPMKLLSMIKTDEERITFYFRSKTRVDFRALVKDLNSYFKAKVELRQVQGREAARAIGGIGRCGFREICCRKWAPIFPKVTAKMIKQLGLEGSPNQYIGACGRLICCLAFELKDFKLPEKKSRQIQKCQKCQKCGRPLDHTHIEIPKAKKKKVEEKEKKKPTVKRIRRILK